MASTPFELRWSSGVEAYHDPMEGGTSWGLALVVHWNSQTRGARVGRKVGRRASDWIAFVGQMMEETARGWRALPDFSQQ